jgi:Protein of unknown function (DUF1638)
VTAKRPLLVIACGAIAHETMAVLRRSGMDGISVQCLPAKLHNRPQLIPELIRTKIQEERDNFERIFVMYGDCGTGGMLDAVLREEGVERIAGAHCYEFFTGIPEFTEMADADPCSFYLTDFLVRHFQRLVIEGLGIDKHPQLLPMYFGNYKRVVYLAQHHSDERVAEAKAAALRLGLDFEYRFTGYGDLEKSLVAERGRIDRIALPDAAD